MARAGFTIGATKAYLRKQAPHIARQYSSLWNEFVTDALTRFERQHKERFSDGVFDEMHDFGIAEVRKHGLPNPAQPSPRVRKALKKYVKRQLALPKNWTPAEVRVNKKGQVQVKVNPDLPALRQGGRVFRGTAADKLGSGTRFARCVKAVAEKGGADPNAVCASAGRKKYGARKMAAMVQAGRKRRNIVGGSNPNRQYQIHVPATRNDRGYELKIAAKSSSAALAEARRYCAKRAGKPVAQFHLPRGTKAKVV